MTHMGIKLAVGAVILAGALGYLGYAGAQKGLTYTVAVDHYLGNPQYANQRVRLTGKVAEGENAITKSGLTVKFTLVGHEKTIPVTYTGVVPDMFKPGSEVLVEGKSDGAGVFQSDVMMTKCASKYDAAPEGHPTERPK